MAIVKSSSVFCDGPGPDDLDGCLQWIAETTEGAAAARRIARDYGWKRRNGKDLCPDCAGNPQPA